MKDEYVYVIGEPGSRTVKIGRTIDVAKRLGDIQRMSPVPLSLLWTHPGGHMLETHLHRHFAGLREHGEWFSFQADPVVMIAWAVESEPWNLPKVKLTKPIPRQRHRANPYLEQPRDAEELARWRASVSSLVDALYAEIRSIPDPVTRFAEIRQVESRLGAGLRAESQGVVLGLKKQGLSWREIGELLGVSGQRAHQISRGDAPRYGKAAQKEEQNGRTVITRPASSTSESSPR